MGVTDLIRLLKPASRNIFISELSNQTAAIDMMTWLYKGVYSCAFESSRDNYLNYPIKMLSLLSAHKITPIAVFDGHRFKPKSIEESNRRESKQKNLDLAKKSIEEGKEEEAKKYSKQALRITSKMINSLIEVLKRLKIKVVVAPYEADAQIAHLCISGEADFAITEDSDLILFGAQKICYKLNHNGEGDYLDIKKFKETPIELISDPYCKIIRKIKHESFIEVCVLSGCDYYCGVKNFGLKVGLKLYDNCDNLKDIIDRMSVTEKFKSSIKDAEKFYEETKKIASIFYYQTIYHTREKTLLPLNSVDDIPKDSSYKECFNEYIDCNDLYGPYFDNYEEFCNGTFDMKIYDKEKDIEEEKIILNYIVYYYTYLKSEIFKLKNNKNSINSKVISSSNKDNKVIFDKKEDKENIVNKDQNKDVKNERNDNNYKYVKMLENEKINNNNNNQINNTFISSNSISMSSQNVKDTQSIIQTQTHLQKSIKEKESLIKNEGTLMLSPNTLNNYIDLFDLDNNNNNHNNIQFNSTKIENIKMEQTETNNFHQLGDDSFDVDILIKMCETSNNTNNINEIKNQNNLLTNPTGITNNIKNTNNNINNINNITNVKREGENLNKMNTVTINSIISNIKQTKEEEYKPLIINTLINKNYNTYNSYNNNYNYNNTCIRDIKHNNNCSNKTTITNSNKITLSDKKDKILNINKSDSDSDDNENNIVNTTNTLLTKNEIKTIDIGNQTNNQNQESNESNHNESDIDFNTIKQQVGQKRKYIESINSTEMAASIIEEFNNQFKEYKDYNELYFNNQTNFKSQKKE